jgi:hypothetical protein
VAPQLHVLGLLTAIDVMVLAAYCQACGRWQQAEDALAAMAERDPESGAAHGHDRHRQLDAKPYASGCAECKQLLLDQLQQPAFLRESGVKRVGTVATYSPYCCWDVMKKTSRCRNDNCGMR